MSLRRLFILFMMFWLPLQTAAALAVPMSLPAVPQGGAHAGLQDEHALMHGHHAGMNHVGQNDAANQAGDEHGGSGGCERCGLCQFVHGGVPLDAGAGVPVVAVSSDFLKLGKERFRAHIPEPLQRPPLLSA